MAAQKFPRFLGRMRRHTIKRKDGKVVRVTYRLDRSIEELKKYNPISKMEFMATSKDGQLFQISCDGEPFDECFDAGHAESLLLQSFERECIREGIADASARHKTDNAEDPHTYRPRLYGEEPPRPPLPEEPNVFRPRLYEAEAPQPPAPEDPNMFRRRLYEAPKPRRPRGE